MFNSYEMTRAFVAERQETLRHEARQHHQARAVRRGRRRSRTLETVQRAVPAAPEPRNAGTLEDRLAA